MPAALAADFMPQRPAWMEVASYDFSPWITPAMIREHGLVTVEDFQLPASAAAELCEATHTVFPWKNGRGIVGYQIAIAVFLPKADCGGPAQPGQ